MRCPNCDKDISDNTSVCPYCNHVISDVEKELDLPALKEEEKEDFPIEEEENDFAWEKTRAISPIHDSELSLVDDITDVIENNEEKIRIESAPIKDDIIERHDEETEETSLDKPFGEVNVGEVNVTSNNVNSVLETKESIDKRRVILAVCVFVAMFAVIFTVLFASNTTKNENVKVSDVDYLEAYHIALSKYYETDDIDDVILLLQEHKNDSEKIEEMQKKTRITCDSLLLTYISEKIDSKEEFEDVTKKYEVFLYGLNNYAKAKVGNNEIKALPDRDYMELTNQFNKIYNDGMIFFDSLDLYNKKDYNKAYSNFELIDNENTYYDNAVYYMSKIVDNILELMEKDIKKLENGVDELSIDDKIERYVQIEEVILGYDRAYVSVNLSKNSSYKKSLASCRELIDEYSRVPTEDKGEE